MQFSDSQRRFLTDIIRSTEFLCLTTALGILIVAAISRPLSWSDGFAFAITIGLMAVIAHRRWVNNRRMPRALAAQGVALGALAAGELFHAMGARETTVTFTTGLVFIAAVITVWRIGQRR